MSRNKKGPERLVSFRALDTAPKRVDQKLMFAALMIGSHFLISASV